MKISQAILSTLAYHDIFEYPLTKEEIHKFLITKARLNLIEKKLTKISNIDEFFTLPHRKKIIDIRKTRQKYSKLKLQRAKFYTKLLLLIPTIKMVAVTGALAMQNSHKNDDIDFLIVCQKGTIWTTRFLANIILLPFRRYPSSKNFENRACLNIFLDDSNLIVKTKNLYTAHEICQLKPIYDKEKTYSKIIKSNQWVKKFLPNWEQEPQSRGASKNYQLGPVFWQKTTFNFQLSTLETFLKKFQLWYMSKKVSSEQIGDTQLFFHPRDTEKSIMAEYKKRLKSLKITSP